MVTSLTNCLNKSYVPLLRDNALTMPRQPRRAWRLFFFLHALLQFSMKIQTCRQQLWLMSCVSACPYSFPLENRCNDQLSSDFVTFTDFSDTFQDNNSLQNPRTLLFGWIFVSSPVERLQFWKYVLKITTQNIKCRIDNRYVLWAQMMKCVVTMFYD